MIRRHYTAVAARYAMSYKPRITTPLVVRLALLWNRSPLAPRAPEGAP